MTSTGTTTQLTREWSEIYEGSESQSRGGDEEVIMSTPEDAAPQPQTQKTATVAEKPKTSSAPATTTKSQQQPHGAEKSKNATQSMELPVKEKPAKTPASRTSSLESGKSEQEDEEEEEEEEEQVAEEEEDFTDPTIVPRSTIYHGIRNPDLNLFAFNPNQLAKWRKESSRLPSNTKKFPLEVGIRERKTGKSQYFLPALGDEKLSFDDEEHCIVYGITTKKMADRIFKLVEGKGKTTKKGGNLPIRAVTDKEKENLNEAVCSEVKVYTPDEAVSLYTESSEGQMTAKGKPAKGLRTHVTPEMEEEFVKETIDKTMRKKGVIYLFFEQAGVAHEMCLYDEKTRRLFTIYIGWKVQPKPSKKLTATSPFKYEYVPHVFCVFSDEHGTKFTYSTGFSKSSADGTKVAIKQTNNRNWKNLLNKNFLQVLNNNSEDSERYRILMHPLGDDDYVSLPDKSWQPWNMFVTPVKVYDPKTKKQIIAWVKTKFVIPPAYRTSWIATNGSGGGKKALRDVVADGIEEGYDTDFPEEDLALEFQSPRRIIPSINISGKSKSKSAVKATTKKPTASAPVHSDDDDDKEKAEEREEMETTTTSSKGKKDKDGKKSSKSAPIPVATKKASNPTSSAAVEPGKRKKSKPEEAPKKKNTKSKEAEKPRKKQDKEKKKKQEESSSSDDSSSSSEEEEEEPEILSEVEDQTPAKPSSKSSASSAPKKTLGLKK